MKNQREVEVFSTEQLAEYLDLSVYTIRRLARDGDIPATKVARRWRFKKHLIDEWLGMGCWKD